jgi:hypothetical protein
MVLISSNDRGKMDYLDVKIYQPDAFILHRVKSKVTRERAEEFQKCPLILFQSCLQLTEIVIKVKRRNVSRSCWFIQEISD